MPLNKFALKRVIKLATFVMKGPISEIAKDTTQKIAMAVANSLKASENRLSTQTNLQTEEANAMREMIRNGVKASKAVAEAIAVPDNTGKEVIDAAIKALQDWRSSDSDNEIDLDVISPTLRNAITAIRSARDDLAVPLLENINGDDLRTTLKKILPDLVNIDLEGLIDKLQTDDSEEGRMIKELLLIVISAINAGRKELLIKLKEIGLDGIFKK